MSLGCSTGKKDFTSTIEDLTQYVSDLAELAPEKTQRELCKQELSEISSKESFAILDDILSETFETNKGRKVLDRYLRDVVNEKIRGGERTDVEDGVEEECCQRFCEGSPRR